MIQTSQVEATSLCMGWAWTVTGGTAAGGNLYHTWKEARTGYTAATMGVFVGMLRAVNVGGRNMIKMEVLRELCEALKFRGAQTYVQSGNVVFACDERDCALVEKKLATAIEKKVGFRPEVMVRTKVELREVIKR